MSFLAQSILDRESSLTEADRNWTIPDKNFEALQNCSLQLEELFELRYERIITNQYEIASYFMDDAYFENVFQSEAKNLHVSLWMIDHFHVGVPGFEKLFWEMAGQFLHFGVNSSLVDHMFDPWSNKFEPEQDPLPPILFHYIDPAGNLSSTHDEFDRTNPTSTQWNFFNGLRSPILEQRQRFRDLYERLEQSPNWFVEDDLEVEFRHWDDPENEPILAALEESKTASGRPKKSDFDDRFALMFSKVLMTRFLGDKLGKVPSRRSCILKVAEHMAIPDHNRVAFHKRLDRKLKRKMSMRNLRQ